MLPLIETSYLGTNINTFPFAADAACLMTTSGIVRFCSAFPIDKDTDDISDSISEDVTTRENVKIGVCC